MRLLRIDTELTESYTSIAPLIAAIFNMSHRSTHAHGQGRIDPTDPSIHLLELPRSRPRLGNWCIFAILIGLILAWALLFLVGLAS